MAGSVASQAPRLSLAGALASFKSAFVGTALMSGMINVLALTGSFFMLQVYDRVIPSRSVPTLIGLCLVAGVLYAFQGVLEVIRSRVLSRIALAMDERLHGRVLPLVSSETTHLSRDWPFASSELGKITGVTFRIRLEEKSGRFESSPVPAQTFSSI